MRLPWRVLLLGATVLSCGLAATVLSCGGSISNPSDGDGGNSSAGSSSGSSQGSSGSGVSSGGNSGSSTGSSSGGFSGSSSGGTTDSSSGEAFDASTDVPGSPPPWDAAIADGTVGDATFDVSPAAPGLAGFGFVVNGVVLTPMSCPADHWEFPLPAGEGQPQPNPPIPGVSSAFIVNTGATPLAYVAGAAWVVPSHYAPGIDTGMAYQLAGVLQPGQQVDITSVYVGDITALLGSAEPFSAVDASYASDEGEIPWPKGVAGSGGSSIMYVAELNVPVTPPSMCQTITQVW
jgi:hypothetical protein